MLRAPLAGLWIMADITVMDIYANQNKSLPSTSQVGKDEELSTSKNDFFT
jgi:hypothetical protein